MSLTEVPGLTGIRRRLLALARRLRQAAKTEVYAFWRRRAVRPRMVLYESFAGNGMLCNPEAIFRALLADPEFGDLTHVWVLTSRRENPAVAREFSGSHSVRFVRPGTFGYFRALATAGFLVNNATFPTEFGKRGGQVYLNTWHGTPLKRMGFDIGDPATRVANVIRNLLSADFLLSASPFMTEHLYEDAHRLGNIYPGRIIEEGYPRIDRQFMDEPSVAAARAGLEAGGLALHGRRIILYAPTWKGTSFSRPEYDISELVSRIDQLESQIDTTKYVVLLKTHQVVHRFAADIPGLRDRVVPNEIPSNVILGVTDVLVTDYSSIFFDFLATGRPIFFLTPDLADYSGYRGLYIEPELWPGPVVPNVTQLAGAINDFDHGGVDDRVASNYREMQARFVAREDGSATQRILDIVFRGKPEGYAVAPLPGDGRRRILIAAGNMRPGAITAELIALLEKIDHSRFDVSVIFPPLRSRPVLDQQRLLHPRVRQFARVGGMNGSKLALARLRSTGAASVRSGARPRTPLRSGDLWRDEWDRCFGSAAFDFTLDFAGTSPFWATLMLQSPDSERSIWLRDDPVAAVAEDASSDRPGVGDTERDVLYDAYDRLVSPSPPQHPSLRPVAVAEPVIGGASILARAALPTEQHDGDAALPDWLGDEGSGAATAVDRIFVSLGRLTVENDPVRLVRAFAVVHAAVPASRLLVVGDGPLASILGAELVALGLTEVVALVGYRTNPFALLAQADCVVFAAGGARTARVLGEARVLGLPVVRVIGPEPGVAPLSGILEVPADDRALAEGMLEFLAGRVGTSSIDWIAHDDRAIGMFYRAIGAITDE
ncbi:CDP-glycerol glycerophosphotransferase family protein [Glaciihabitans sp. INWT7]|uniref:CDP-glycerol glycerophosphotransferase family protein n=1 Tax=Glaciihabitans sp. INWT7 TaxID=2596912 RepID=UPI0021082EDD|nr:CDP-glycerol glycerophosphotransferase family protein [Glaciihabitans sp. INWT7]